MRGFTLIELVAVLGFTGIVFFIVGLFLHWAFA